MHTAVRTIAISIILLMALASCAGSIVPAAPATVPATLTPTIPASPTPKPSFTSTPTLTASPTLTVPASTPTSQPPVRTRYRMDVVFDFYQYAGSVREDVVYTNETGETLIDLLLVAPLFSYGEALAVTGLWWGDGQPVEKPVRDGILISFPLQRPLAPGQGVSLRIDYNFVLPSQAAVSGERPQPIGTTSRQANLVDWYLFIPPYRQGSGWLAPPPAYYGEHLVYDLADFEVNLKLAGSTDLTVAASSRAELDGDWLRYRHEGARGFALSISPEYATAVEEVNGVIVTSYYFPANETAGTRALQTTVEALDLYSELFGPYPHDTLAVVEADFYDGMEYDGLYFLSRAFYNLHQGRPDDYLVAIAAHETAHQWWYGRVGNNQANEPWLDEALCTYSEHMFYERYYPEALDWWWNYRIQYYRPSGWVDTSVYNPQGALQTYQDYRNAVYLNGARFLHELRDLIGDEAFFAFLNAYSERFSGKIATGDDFFRLLAEFSSADLTSLLDTYFSNR